jgi:hypothetical protein
MEANRRNRSRWYLFKKPSDVILELLHPQFSGLQISPEYPNKQRANYQAYTSPTRSDGLPRQ